MKKAIEAYQHDMQRLTKEKKKWETYTIEAVNNVVTLNSECAIANDQIRILEHELATQSSSLEQVKINITVYP